jgi:hypothetical protein
MENQTSSAIPRFIIIFSFLIHVHYTEAVLFILLPHAWLGFHEWHVRKKLVKIEDILLGETNLGKLLILLLHARAEVQANYFPLLHLLERQWGCCVDGTMPATIVRICEVPISFTLHRAKMNLLILHYYNALHVSALTAIIRRYNLMKIFKQQNCALYIFSYNLNTHYYMCLVSYLDVVRQEQYKSNLQTNTTGCVP